MSTTPLPPLPSYGINTANHAHIRVQGYTSKQMQAYTAQARADLEAENARLRHALEFVARHKSSDWPERCQQMVDMARAVLKEQP